MKLLVTTQMVDKNDPILGFFHGWLLEFSKHFEAIHVICLKEGAHDLPENVFVYSLGKEKGESRLKYVTRFFYFAWGHRKEYEIVFSHMNPHYIVLAGWLWKLLGKRMFFWRNHAKMNVQTYIAAFFAKKVFYTSPFACTARFKHGVKMPVGIDTHIFTPQKDIERVKNSVLFLGRLSPVKRPELFLQSANLLEERISVDIYGDVSSEKSDYQKVLRELSLGKVEFHAAVSNSATPAIYSAAELYVNLTPEGSMDKTILEAAACGCLVLVSNRSFVGSIPEKYICTSDDPGNLAQRMRDILALSTEEKQADIVMFRSLVLREHSLQKLVQDLDNYFRM